MYQEQAALVVVRLLIAEGQEDGALHLLDQWRTDAQAKGRVRSEMEIMILMTLAHAGLEDLPRAEQALIQALELAQTECHRRLFLDEGRPLAVILQSLLLDIQEEAITKFSRTLLYEQAQQTRRETAPSSG